MLTTFDRAVIDYAHSRGESSEAVYRRIEQTHPDRKYRDQYSESELLAMLQDVQRLDSTH